jgi:redox-sensitive bicupin YhaK (pirin superfamily)
MEGVAPSYQQAYFSNANHGIWQLLVSPNGENHSLSIRQSVRVYRAKIQPEQKIVYELDRGRCLWLQMISGKLIANENELYAGDGLGLQAKLSLTGIQEAEVLLFDLPS